MNIIINDMRKLLFWLMMMVFVPSLVVSCSDDDSDSPADSIDIQNVKRILSGEYVAFTKVTVNSVDKTLLDGGCPTRLVFGWDDDSLSVMIPEMKIGNMPFAISYKSNCEIVKLNSWEADEHAGGNDSWIKFVGTNGYVSMGDSLKPNGSSIKGYFNPETKVIEFDIDYNVMNVRTICERQELDVERTRDYDVEMEKYMKELVESKRENGLDILPPSYDIDIPDSPSRDSTPSKGDDNSFISFSAIKGMLTDDIVLNANIFLAGSQKAQDVPTIVNFSWSDDVMTVKLDGLSIGSMPFKLNFRCDCVNKQLSSDDLNNYSPMWFKMEGDNGNVSSVPTMASGSEGKVVCYFNPVTMQIVLNIDFNVAGASASFPNQVIDYSRIDNYDQEIEDFQRNNLNK